MNIALINPEYPSPSGRDHGGIATYVYTMANALCEADHQVHVITRKDTNPDTLNSRIQFHTFHNTPLSTPLSFFSRKFNSAIYWKKGCSKAAFDLVQEIHTKSHLDVIEIPEYNGLASQFFGPLPYSVVINFHTPTRLIDELNHTPVTSQRNRVYTYEKNALKNATAFRCPSKSLTDRLKNLYAISPDDVTVIHNPIPTTFFDAIDKSKTPSDDRCEVLFSGRLERRKGAEIILKTINSLLECDTRVHVTFAGETDLGESASYRQTIERTINSKNRKRIWFLGPQNREKLSFLYCRSDVFLMPSLFENSPYSLLEAMAAKLPVIGADTSGISEIIQHNENGLLFSLDNPQELCTCLKDLIANPQKRDKLGQRAHDDVCNNFNPKTIAMQTVAFYKSIQKNR